MSTYLERMDKKKKEEEQSSSYSTYLERKEAKNILNGTDTFLQDYSTLVNNHNQTLKDTNNFLKSNELTNDNLHSNIINDSDNFNNLRDKLSKFRNEFVQRYGEKSVSKMEDRLSNLGQSIKSTSKNIETIKNQKSEINAIKAEAEKQSDLLYPGQKTKSDNVSSLEVNEAKQLTGNPMDILFNNTSAKQDEALVKNTRGYANKYANMSYAQLKNSVAKNSNSMSDDEKNFVQKLKTTRLREEGTAEDAKNEYEQLIKNGANENSPEVSHLKEMYQDKYDSENYSKLSQLSDDDVIKALYSDVTTGYGADPSTQNWQQQEHFKKDDVKSYITNYGSLSLLKKYRDYLSKDGEYTDRNELAHSLLGNTDAFDSTKNKNEDEINQLDDVIKIREQENYIDDTYKELSKSHDFGKYGFVAKGKDLKNITSKEKYDIVIDYLNNKFGGSSDEAKGFKDNTETYSNYVTAQEDRQKTQEFAKEHPVLGTLQSIVTNLGNSLSLLPLADTVDSVVGIDIDTNDKLHTISRLTNDLREGAKSNLGETGQFIYDTAMSAVDSASYVAMGNALGVAGEAVGIANATNYVPEIVNGLMGNIVAQQAIVEGKEKGYSDTKAVSMGIIQAAIEAITEQYSLDTIIKHPNLLKGALVEGSEEVASNWLNNVVDAVANGDKNRYRQAVNEYKKENPNASDGEALASAICDSFKDDGLSFIAGGLSGAAMSGTQVGINKVKQSSIDRQVRNSNIEALDSIINNDKFKDTEVQQQANYLKNKVLNKDEITRYDMIKLQNADIRTELNRKVPDDILNNTAEKSDIEVATENGVEKVKSSLGLKHPNGILATVEGTDAKAITNIVSSDSGKMVVQTDTGDTVNLEDVKFNHPSLKNAFEQASKYDTNGAKQYIIAIEDFKGKTTDLNKAFDALYKLGNSGYDYEGDIADLKNYPAQNEMKDESKDESKEAPHIIYDKAIEPSNTKEELPPSQKKLINNAMEARKVLGVKSMNVVNAGWNDYANALRENQRLINLAKEEIEHHSTMYDVAKEEAKNYIYKDGILTSADIDKPSEQQSNVSETQNSVQEQQNVENTGEEKTSNSINYDNKNKLFNELVTDYAGNESEFTDLYNKAYTAGYRGVSYKSVANNINYANVIRELGSKNVQRIIELGKADSIARVKELVKKETPTQNNKVSGKVIISDSVKSKVNDTSLYEHIANKIGSDIYIEDIKDKRINGYLDKDGIHLNANHGQEGMLYAVCHEAIHKLKLANIKGYKELKNFVMDVLTDSGVNIDSRTMDVINSYSDTDSLDINNLTEEAEEEIVANAFGSIISNEQAMNKAYALSSDKKSHLVSAIKSIINKLKEFLNKLSGHMPEVKALKNNINAQIKMAEIFAKNVENSIDGQEVSEQKNYDVIKYSLHKEKYKKGFKKALNEYEWHIFNSSMVDSQTKGFRVDDNGILIPNQNDAYSYKLVLYDDFEDGPQIQEVYKLENYNYNIHEKDLNVVSIISELERLNYGEKFRRQILLYYNEVSKTILKRFNVRTGRWNSVIKEKDRRSIRFSESKIERRTNDESTKENKGKGSDSLRRLNDTQLGANLPGKKFSIFEDGTDKNLVAMHNLSADNLETALNRGGFPMPSIAVTKDNISHNDFGEVSVLFDKDTIDPEINNNHVYGSDVYSPTHPGLEYKVNEKKSKEVYDYFKDELKNKDMAFKVNPVNFSSANLSKKINSLKGEENYIKSFSNDYGMKNLYLSLSNNQVDKVNDIEKTEVKDVDELTADFYNYLYDTMGQKIETVRNMVGRNWYKENKEQFKSVVQSYVNLENDSNIRAKKKALVDKKTSSGFASAATVKNVINFKDNNGKIVKTETVSDVDGAKREIDKRINQKDYEQWLKDTFNGIVEKTGIRKPNVDAYTSRGDRKSFEQLHYADTLDNIVKAMKDVQNGESFFGGNQLWAIGSKEYSSIKDIKVDSSRLQMLSDEEHSEIKSELGVRFQNIAKELVNNNDLMSLDSAYNNIADAVRHSKNEKQMLKYLKEYYPKTATSEIVSEIVNLLDDVSNMPTGYFEAKPQRVISPGEIKAVVIPAGTSANVIELLKKNNIPYYEYSSDENRTVATQQAINDTKIRFSKFADKIKKEETRSEKALKMTNETLSELLNMTEEKGFVDDDKVYQNVAKKILKKYNCNFSSKTFAENVKTVMNYANNQKVLDNNDYINQLTYVANEALDKHRSIKDNFAEERKVVNDYFNKKNLLLSDKQKEILDFGIGANTFINKMYGMANIVTDRNLLSSDSNTMYLKEAYESLQDKLGIDFLPMATEEEIPGRLLQLKELLKPQINIDGMNRYDVSMNMVQDFVTELAKSKYSNKNTEITKKINQLVSQQKQWNNELKKEYNQKLREEKKKYENNLKKYQSEVGDYRQKITYEKHQKINDLRAKQKDTLELYKDRRMQTVYKDKIRKMCGRLGKMINTEIRKEGIPLPTKLIRTMSSLADIIDPGTTRNGNIVTGYSTFMKLKSIYDGLKEADNEANQGSAEGIYALHYQKAISNLIEELAVQIDETPLNKLNGYQLKKVYDTLHMVENNFRDAKKVIVKGKTIEYSKLGIQTIYDLRDVRGNLRKNSDKNKWIVPKLNKYSNYLLDFTRFIKKVVGYNEEDPLYKQAMEFDKADSKEAKIRMESKQTFEDVFAKMEATKAEGYKHKSVLDVFDGKDAKMLDFGLKDRFTGEPVKISAAMAVSIYQMSMNEDNKRHFVLGQRNVDVPGGLNIPNNALWQKGKKTEARSQHHTVVMSEEILDKISKYVINNELLLELSNATDKFFNEVSRKYIDETAKRLYGYPISIESHYFPINTNKNYIKTEFETVVLNASLENKGFTKHRTNGHNPIWLDDVTEVINNHMNGLAKYAAYTPIIRDFKKVYNYTAPDYQTSVKDEIEKRWGASATQYIDNFMKDLQKPYTSNPSLSKWRGRFAQSVLAMNLSVTMKQAASYPTAAAIIGYKPLAKALAYGENAEGEKKILFYRANRAEINSMTGVFFDRYQGDNTAEMREFITDNGWAKKVPYLMNWIQKADVATTGRLWQACKYYVEDELKIQKYKENGKEYTDEYKEALVDTYEKVIKNTQPMYSTVHRPAVLRSHNELMRTLVMFKTQSFQNFGIMFEATGNYRAKAKAYYSSKTEANKIALDKAKKQFVRAISSQIVAGMTLSAMALLYNAIIHRLDRYKDDEGELTWLSILSTFSSDFMETMSGCVLWGSEAYEVISNIIKVSNGGTVYNSDIVDLGVFNTINDLQDAIIGMLRTCFADEFDGDKFVKYSYKIASCAAKALGIPLDNAKNLVMGGVNLVKDCVDNGSPLAFKAGSNISLSTSDYAEHLYEYLVNNDKEGYTKLYNKAMADGIDSKKIQTALKEQLVGNEFVQKAAVALHNDDIGTYESSSRVLILQGFDADTVKKAVDSYISQYLEKEEDKKKTKIKDDYTEKELFDSNEGQTAQYSFDDLWRAKENDSSSYQTIYDALIEQGKKPSAIKSAMKAREKKEKEEQNN